jgi:hypothetical protein
MRKNYLPAFLTLLLLSCPLKGLTSDHDLSGDDIYIDHEYTIDFSQKSLNELSQLDEADFDHEEIFLQSVTPTKFNKISAALLGALNNERYNIKKISYSYDEDLKKFPATIDHFLTQVAIKERVVICKFGAKTWDTEVAPTAGQGHRGAAQRYHAQKEDREIGQAVERRLAAQEEEEAEMDDLGPIGYGIKQGYENAGSDEEDC